LKTKPAPANSVESQLKGATRSALIYSFGNIRVKAVSFLLINNQASPTSTLNRAKPNVYRKNFLKFSLHFAVLSES
jgi:hypothetical protein